MKFISELRLNWNQAKPAKPGEMASIKQTKFGSSFINQLNLNDWRHSIKQMKLD